LDNAACFNWYWFQDGVLKVINFFSQLNTGRAKPSSMLYKMTVGARHRPGRIEVLVVLGLGAE
jgi:hypothetical protein